MTGAILPEGADCVIQFEDTDAKIRDNSQHIKVLSEVSVLQSTKPGVNVRKSGEQILKGSLVVPKNVVLGPAELGVLASLGLTQVKVTRRPVAAIIGTGEELTMPGKSLDTPCIFNGNSFNIAAQVLRCGGIPKIQGIARDSRTSLLKKIRQGMTADMVITTGGVSFGDHDLVKEIIDELGETIFEHVNMSPGKSFTFGLLHIKEPSGKINRIPHFALAGNPPASMINFEILVRPAIFKMLNKTDTFNSSIIEATLEESISNRETIQHYEWVTVKYQNGVCFALPTRSRIREVLSSIVLAQGLAVVPEGKPQLEKGQKVQVILLDWR
jgi:molybdopterin molybdotransferase